MKNQEPNAILIADANAIDADRLQSVFSRAGILGTAIVALNGPQVVAHLEGGGPWPKALFLDLRLPDAGGFDVLQWLRDRAELKGIPVIVTSGVSQLKDVGRAYALGAHAFLPKPYQIEDVRRLIAEFPVLKGPPRSCAS